MQMLVRRFRGIIWFCPVPLLQTGSWALEPAGPSSPEPLLLWLGQDLTQPSTSAGRRLLVWPFSQGRSVGTGLGAAPPSVVDMQAGFSWLQCLHEALRSPSGQVSAFPLGAQHISWQPCREPFVHHALVQHMPAPRELLTVWLCWPHCSMLLIPGALRKLWELLRCQTRGCCPTCSQRPRAAPQAVPWSKERYGLSLQSPLGLGSPLSLGSQAWAPGVGVGSQLGETA